jgi:hypothetical protein
MQNIIKIIKIIFVVFINFITVFILLEIATPFIYSLINKRDFDKQSLKHKLNIYSTNNEFEFNQRFAEANFITNKVIHPYLGFVYDTNVDPSQWSEYFGFGNNKNILNNSKNTVKIVITGGSVAQGLFNNANNIIINNLRTSNIYGEKNIKIFNLTMGGFKQPQQLMVLNYFLLLGGEFDIWINLDGFNEITLPISENWKSKVASFYPRLWNIYAKKSLEKNAIDKMIEVKTVRHSRKKLNLFFSKKLITESSFCLFLWEIFDQRLANEEYQLNKDLFAIISQQKPSYQVSGPVSVGKKWQNILSESVNIWKRSSLLMGNISQTNGIIYFHFLQPNQYLKGSKNLSKEERIIAHENGPYDYKVLVEAGYPKLIHEGEKIKESGILFYDLTMLFEEEKRPVYSDKCCHFNELGYRLIANKISQAIIHNHLSN